MKRYTITTERGLKFHILADDFGLTEYGSIGFSKTLDGGEKIIVCVTPATSTIEVHDHLPDSLSK